MGGKQDYLDSKKKYPAKEAGLLDPLKCNNDYLFSLSVGGQTMQCDNMSHTLVLYVSLIIIIIMTTIYLPFYII